MVGRPSFGVDEGRLGCERCEGGRAVACEIMSAGRLNSIIISRRYIQSKGCDGTYIVGAANRGGDASGKIEAPGIAEAVGGDDGDGRNKQLEYGKAYLAVSSSVQPTVSSRETVVEMTATFLSSFCSWTLMSATCRADAQVRTVRQWGIRTREYHRSI